MGEARRVYGFALIVGCEPGRTLKSVIRLHRRLTLLSSLLHRDVVRLRVPADQAAQEVERRDRKSTNIADVVGGRLLHLLWVLQGAFEQSGMLGFRLERVHKRTHGFRMLGG